MRANAQKEWHPHRCAFGKGKTEVRGGGAAHVRGGRGPEREEAGWRPREARWETGVEVGGERGGEQMGQPSGGWKKRRGR